MRALVWRGLGDVRVETVPDPEILNPRDAIIRVTSTAICGSDLHLYSGFVPTLRSGDILGHEFMGEVVEVGSGVTNLAVGDRVIVPATIACGACFYCRRQLWSCCDNSNPNAAMAEAIFGYSASGIFGYSHLFGGYAGGQAELVRVPFADVGPYRIPSELPDESVLFLTDVFPTGYQAALFAEIEPGDTVAVWGCGAVGQFAIRSAFVLGAERVIAIDRFPERLAMAAAAGAETLDYEQVGDVVEELKFLTGGMGPDACIDSVGSEAHTANPLGVVERALQAARIQLDRPHVLREVLQACRKGGRVSLAGVYGGFVNAIPMGAAFNKGLTIRAGQVHVHRYRQLLLDQVVNGDIDPTFVITHRLPLEEAARGYEMFQKKEDGCIKVVLRPDGADSPGVTS